MFAVSSLVRTVLRQDHARAFLLDSEPACTSCGLLSPSNHYAKRVGPSLLKRRRLNGESRDVHNGLCLDKKHWMALANDAVSWRALVTCLQAIPWSILLLHLLGHKSHARSAGLPVKTGWWGTEKKTCPVRTP